MNVIDYLRLENVIACGGSWMVKPEYIRVGNFDTIQQLSATIKEKIAEGL